MMKKANVLVVPNGATTMAVSCSPPGPTSPKHAGPTPTILVSDAATITKGAGGSNNDGSRSPDRRKEKKEKIEKERIEKERRKMEKEQKKGKSDSKEGKLDRFRGSKITMEKFFKKKIKDREERKEKEKEERERESILAEEGSLGATDNGGGDDAANAKEEQPKDKEKKKKKEKKDKKDKDKKKAAAADYYEASSGRDEDDGGDELKRKKKRKKASSSTSSSPSSTLDKDKDPMEREAEREDEREESQGGSSDDNSSSDTDDSEEEERRRGKNLLRPDGAGVDALRPQRRRKKDWTVSQEFRVLALETEEKQKPDFSFALQHKNRDKNRYGNALPNPETRVVLKGGDTDYINANYIQGEQTQYIAAQAPLPNTFGDFWLMVWEQNTRVIMMLTRLTENDRTKAEIYWPRKGPLGRARGSFSSGDDGDSDGDGDDATGWKQYGKMRVSLTKSTLLEDDEDVAIRHFRLRNDDEPDVERQVIQIHFTGWPDFGVPQSTKSFIQLLELMESFNKEPTITESSEPNGPIILHCSAGLGRTGTLIAAHIAAEKLKLKRLNSKEDIDMKAIVAQLREQRSGMVQTKCQYKFLHDLLNDL